MRLNTPKRTAAFIAWTLFLLLGAKARATDTFSFSGSSAGNYNVQKSVTINVTALNGGVPDLGFTDTVTVGLYTESSVDTGSPVVADPRAIITINGGLPVTGTAPYTFTGKPVTFVVTFETGTNNGEAFWVRDAGISGGDSVGAFNVTGFTTTYYFETVSGTQVLATPSPDILTTDSNAATNVPDIPVTIPYSVDGTTAASFAITGLNAAYAGNLTKLVTSFWAKKAAASVSNSNVYYEVIVDYTGGMSDYNSIPAGDSIFLEGPLNLSTTYNTLPQGTSVGAPLSITSGLTNGQVVVRVWSETPLANCVNLLRIKSKPVNFASSFSFPYSNLNALPVKGSVSPNPILAGSSPTVIYTINNLSNVQLQQTNFKIPANPSGGTDWTLAGAPTTRAGGTVTYLNPSGSTDGYVDINWSSPVTVGETVAVTMTMSPATSVAQAGWDFGFLLVQDITSQNVLSDSTSAQNVLTLSAPDVPGTPTVVPANYTGTGGQIALSWTAVTNNQSPLGYIITRNPGGGNFTSITLPSGTVVNNAVTLGPASTVNYTDNSAVNLTAYTYTLQTFNTVTQSGASAPSVSVAAFANPGPPTAMQALTGGTTVQLNWTAPVSVSGSYQLAGYQVWRDTQASMATAAAIASVGLVTTYQDTTVSAGVSYYYGLSSIDNQYSSGVTNTPHNGARSNPTVSGFPNGWPPTGLSSSLVSNSPATIGLAWTAPAPASILNGPVSYVIFRANTVPGPAVYSVLTTAPSGTVSINDSSALVSGDTYGYYVVAVDNKGVTSNASTTITQGVGPGAPPSINFTTSASAITLAWPPNPALQNVVDYVVYRNGSLLSDTAGATIYSDGAIVQGTNYGYQVEAVNNAGVTGPLGPLSGPVSWALPPLAETSLGVTITGALLNNNNVTWPTLIPANANAVSYLVSRNTSNVLPGAPIAALAVTVAGNPVTTYLDGTALTPGTIYYYFLQAKDIGGAGPAIVQGVQIPPSAPTTTIASTSNASTITVNWKANIAGNQVAYYTVYRTTLPVGTPTAIATVTAPTITYNDTTAAQGLTYVYNLTATNLGSGATIVGGESLMSGSITIGLAPPQPGGFNVTGITTANNISLAWTDVTNGAGGDPNATSVSLLVNTSNSSAGASVVNLTPANTTTYLDSGLYSNTAGETPDTTYYYFLKTNNPFGSSVLSASVSQLTYPAPVTLNSVTAAPNGVSRILTFNIVGGADVTQYNFYRELQGGSSFVSIGSAAAQVGPSMSVTLSNSILPGEIYLYKATAMNATGEGSSATTVSFGTAPSDPSSVTAVSGVSASGVTVNLTWADSNYLSENVSGYTVYRATAQAGPYSIVSPVNGISVPTTTYSDGAVSPPVGTTVYYYLVEADDNNGKESISNTTNAVAVTAYAIPDPPNILTETDGNTTASLTWNTAVSTTYSIAGYNIYDSLSGGATVKANATPIVGTAGAASGLTNGGNYNLFLQAVDSQGHLSALSAPVAGLPVAAPSKPVSVGASPGNSANQVSWFAASQGTMPVSYYIVQKIDLSGPTTTTIQVPGNQSGYFDNTSVTNGLQYVYSVETVDDSGVTTGTHVSGFSPPVTVTAGLVTVNPPSQLLATGGNAQAVLTWVDSVGSSAPVTGYQIYRANVAAGPYSALGTVSTGVLTYTDSVPALTNGNTYYYYMVSYATGLPSSASATVVVIPASPPAAPTPVAVADGSQENLSWTASPNQGAVTISKYLINQDILPAAPTTLGATTGPVTAYTDSTVNNSGETVIYEVAAVNSNGTTGALSAPVTGYPYGPFAPGTLTSSAGSAAVTLSWPAPGSPTWPVVSYNVIRTPLAGGTPVTLTTAALTLTDATATQDQLYLYTVSAVDSKGHVSVAAGPVTDAPVNQINGPATVLISAGNGQVLLDWQAPVSAAGSLPVSEYIVTPILPSLGLAITVVAGQPWDLQLGLTNGAAVSFTVQSVDITGQTSGNHLSAPVTVTTTPSLAAYNPPTGLTAVASGPTSVQLTWTRPNDEGNIVLSYNIYRATSFTTSLGSPIANIANSALAPVTAYTDTTATGNNTYYYRVTAVYQTGATTTESPASNHALVTTPPPTKPIPPVTMSTMAFDANVLKPLTGQLLGIYFIVPTTGPVEIDIYNVTGYPIRYLNPGVAQAGVQTNTTWDGTDRNGKLVATGIYLIEIKATGFHQVKKVAVVK